VAAEGRRAPPDVDGDVHHGAPRHAKELGLRGGRGLEVQAAERAGLGGEGVVVLDELGVDPRLGEIAAVVCLAEKAAVVAEPPRLDDQDAREFGRGHLDRHVSRPPPSRG